MEIIHNLLIFCGDAILIIIGEGVELYKLAPLVFREHSIWPYRGFSGSSFHSNVVQLPLGYMYF